ncbi:MAG: hypothetical protein J5647_00045 [Spirochaetaceae bacterium]|nr:hypothetical protein [Spirochaetaceae bacterium]
MGALTILPFLILAIWAGMEQFDIWFSWDPKQNRESKYTGLIITIGEVKRQKKHQQTKTSMIRYYREKEKGKRA